MLELILMSVMLKETTDKWKLICDQLRTASDRQKSYADLKLTEIEYEVEEKFS